jgi:ketosteroid isomerase-like protein
MKQFAMRLPFYLISLFFFTACTSGKKSINIDSVKKHIDAMNLKYNDRFSGIDTALYENRYCKDAQTLAEGMPPLTGREAIKSYYFNNGENKELTIELKATNIYGNAELVVEEGTYSFPDGKGGVIDQGKFIALWKEENKQWKIFREMWNSNIPKQ